MGAKQNDLTGLKFNKLTVLNLINHNEEKTYKKRYWLCLCDCGNKTKVSTSQIVSQKTTSCGCNRAISNVINSANSRYKIAKKDAGYNSIFNSYKANANLRNKSFEIQLIDFIELLKGNCFYCDSEPKNVYYKSYYNITYNGVDRRDNNLGYTFENSVSCCKMCNIAKNNNTESDFKKWIEKVYNNLEKLKQYDTK
jgi:hypothetical protein